MAGRNPWVGQGLKMVKSTTTMVAMAATMVTVGQHIKEWDSNNAMTAMILLMTAKIMRITGKKEGGWNPHPPGNAAQEDWWRTAANGYG